MSLPARSIAVLALGFALILPWPAAAAPRPGVLTRPAGAAEPRASSAGFFSQLWAMLTSVWGEEGCILDPHGCAVNHNTVQGPTSPQDAGCILDPVGCAKAVAAAEQVDAGCIIDPHGER
jgi:hypothetical protein